MRTWVGALVIVGCQADTFVTPDASVDAAADVANDSSVTDTSPPLDSQPGDAGCVGPMFCSKVLGSPIFCVDFDGISNISMGWDGAPTVTGGFTVDFGYDMYISCPHSVMMTVSPSKPGTAWLQKSIALTNTGRLVVDVDVRLPSNPSGNDFTLFEVRTGPNGTPPSTGLLFTSGSWQVRAGGALGALTMPSTDWVHCSLDTTVSATGGITTVFTVLGEAPVAVADSTPLGTLGSFVTVAVGVGTTTTAPPGPIYYDNVVVRLK
jgi:hypothetical protein